MKLTRWNSLEGLMSVDQDIDRLFEDFFGGPAFLSLNGGVWAPAADIAETDDNVLLTLEIPGMTRDDVKITLQDNLLTIRGEKKQEKEWQASNYHRVERSYGSFVRSFTLPTAVQPDRIKAQYKDGLLKVTVPKAEEVKPKEIPVAVEGK